MNNQAFYAALSGDLSWRAFAVFAVCSAAYHADQPFTIPEIATALQLSERQTRRIVSDLCDRGFLARGSSKRKVFVLPAAPLQLEPAALAPTDRGDRVWVEAPAAWSAALSKLGKPNASRAKIKAGSLHCSARFWSGPIRPRSSIKPYSRSHQKPLRLPIFLPC